MSDTCCLIKNKDEAASLSAHLKSDLSLKERKTVLFVALDSIGHINSLIGIADCLKKRGHRTVFLFLDPIDSELSKKGHEVYDCSTEELVESRVDKSVKNDKWSRLFQTMDDLMRDPTTQKLADWLRMAFNSHKNKVIQNDEVFGRKLKLINPDVIILDQFHVQPSIYKSGIPWAMIWSPSPLGLHPIEHNLPPSFIGLPTNWLQVEDAALKEQYLQSASVFRELNKELAAEWQEYLRKEHQIEIDDRLIQTSKHLNVYFYPKELDYEMPLDNWQQCDSILRVNNIGDFECPRHNKVEFDHQKNLPKFEIPTELKDKPGKLIFLSMGTLACNNVNLMKRLVDILSKCPHRFIVSKGPKADEYELAPNMWGQKHVDQLAILQVIDMIITHGGNNTITECFYYGVPGFIVCPAFGDQMDNAQRIEECKLGKRIDPFKSTEQQFLGAVEEILADETIRPRMKAISERMQKPESKYKAIKLFTNFVEDQQP